MILDSYESDDGYIPSFHATTDSNGVTYAHDINKVYGPDDQLLQPGTYEFGDKTYVVTNNPTFEKVMPHEYKFEQKLARYGVDLQNRALKPNLVQGTIDTRPWWKKLF